jgi:hypothetical protein
MRDCKLGCLHRAFVQAYQQERERQYSAAVEAARGYQTELAEYLQLHPLPTFKQWLIASAAKAAAEAA